MMRSATQGDPQVVFNGVDGRDGRPFFAAPSLARLGELLMAAEEAPSDRLLGELAARRRAGRAHNLGPGSSVDPRRLEEAGWGVVFAADADPAVREALRPLLDHRRRSAGRLAEQRYREIAGADGYRRGESKRQLLARHGVGAGPADPDRMPYYVLLVGGPEEIPWSVQHQLDVQYAVGRLSFETAEDYARYAASVCTAEAGGYPRQRRTAVFATRGADDPATRLLHDELVLPLVDRLGREAAGWGTVTALGREATRSRLVAFLAADAAPALLFSACHGRCYPPGTAERRELEGSLVCQVPVAGGGDGAAGDGAAGDSKEGEARWFTAADVPAAAHLGGLVAFVFACCGAGVSGDPDIARREGDEPLPSGEPGFVARLPQRLLSHPGGAAAAFVGHVDRAFTYSFTSPQTGPQLEVFLSTLLRLLAGYPVGAAMEYFAQRYAELQCDLADLREWRALGAGVDAERWASLWTSCRDARNFVILGDPAVRLAVGGEPAG